jgi:hypothetical protein
MQTGGERPSSSGRMGAKFAGEGVDECEEEDKRGRRGEGGECEESGRGMNFAELFEE